MFLNEYIFIYTHQCEDQALLVVLHVIFLPFKFQLFKWNVLFI